MAYSSLACLVLVGVSKPICKARLATLEGQGVMGWCGQDECGLWVCGYVQVGMCACGSVASLLRRHAIAKSVY